MNSSSSLPAARKRSALIIGGGHNGLVCAFYLARAGFAVTVLERRGVVGGAAVTEEFHPGFRNSVASYTVSLLNPTIAADMNLAGHGLKVVERKVEEASPYVRRAFEHEGAQHVGNALEHGPVPGQALGVAL